MHAKLLRGCASEIRALFGLIHYLKKKLQLCFVIFNLCA